MRNTIVLLLGGLLFLSACGDKPLAPVEFAPLMERVSYTEVNKILVKRCVVCHSCYNSPCQLKLSSFEGLDRGTSRKAVYNAHRLETMAPTRLFVDARNTEEWRAKGFTSVTENTLDPEQCAPDAQGRCTRSNSLMLQILHHRMTTPITAENSTNNTADFHPEAEDLTCAENDGKLGSFLTKHPNRGMPFGFPPLTRDEFNTVANWLMQGAVGPVGREKDRLYHIPAEDQEFIDRWERFLNLDDPQNAMTARYLYEHLFLAHITFGSGSGKFYELVRSTTGPGEKIHVIPTVRPYDDPGEGCFSYRFRLIHSTIVHKTHMVFPMDMAMLRRVQELFMQDNWLQPPHRMGYDRSLAANPFRTFEQIPARARYQFLLDNIHYIIMTFIRGPVCKGQVALNVVRDHFWLLFLDPDYDLAVQNPGFLKVYGDLLEMPALEKNDWKLARDVFSRTYRKKSSGFVAARKRFYESHYQYRSPGAEAIWAGNRRSDSPLLTVFRHFDSASVHRGPLGNLPRTLWVMDYPLVERIYYNLVAGFDVYGNAIHQLSTRVYMDELRQEGETYFLDFMPKSDRRKMMSDWYGGMDLEAIKLRYTPSDLEAGFPFRDCECDPKREFVEYLVKKVFAKTVDGIGFDQNYLDRDEQYPPMPMEFTSFGDYVQGFLSVARPGTSFFSTVASHNANVAYVEIQVDDNPEHSIYLSIVINRWHDDVTTLFGEEDRLDPSKDNATFLKGFIGSYPNYFFVVGPGELPDFLRMLETFNGSEEDLEQLDRFGMNRIDPQFWQVYDRFQAAFDRFHGDLTGVLDLNRYYHEARLDVQEKGDLNKAH